MRIFCPEHGKGFFAPRQNPVKCENRGHTMGELDFEGEARTPAEARWEYCCNCAHFFLLGSSADGIERCPACARQLFTRYVCDRCYTITCESNTPAETKNFTLTTEGLPRPTCPGCLQSPTKEVREHDCDRLGATFVTALTSCPICHERLDVSPAFPATVAYYLKRTRKKLNVTFDYDTEIFCPAEDGEYVVVQNGKEVGHELLLPRMPSFSTKRDFYEHYQDSFFCSEPTAGEVEVIEPAIVDRVENGWKLHTQGALKVVRNQASTGKKASGLTKERPIKTEVPPKLIKTAVSPKPIVTEVSPKQIKTELPPEPTEVSPKPITTEVSPNAIKTESPPEPIRTEVSPRPIRAEVSPKPITTEVSSMITCSHCNSVIESKYLFCWHCGRPTGSNVSLAKATFIENTRLAHPMFAEDEITISLEPKALAAGPPSIFAWALEEPATPVKINRSAFKLIAVVVAGMILIAVLLFFVFQSSSSKVPSAGALSQKPADEARPALAAQLSVPVTQAPKASPAPDVRSADLELQKIKDKRVGGEGSEREKILRELKTAETDYPNDYRFPYEQAKVSINPQDHRSHHEAFGAMMRAAQKAIEDGKADEMLASLTSDKDAEFYKLSRGHSEWKVVEQALRDKDKSKLDH